MKTIFIGAVLFTTLCYAQEFNMIDKKLVGISLGSTALSGLSLVGSYRQNSKALRINRTMSGETRAIRRAFGAQAALNAQWRSENVTHENKMAKHQRKGRNHAKHARLFAALAATFAVLELAHMKGVFEDNFNQYSRQPRRVKDLPAAFKHEWDNLID